MGAKETSNTAATAKRSATAIQRLARCLDDLTDKEKGQLAEAAEILEKHGNRAKNKAASEKRAEQTRERAQVKARAEARQIINAWPQVTTLDRISIIHATRGGVERLARREDESDPRWEIGYATREAAEDIVSDSVLYAVPYSASTPVVPVADHLAQRRALVDQIRVRPGIAVLAGRWDERISHQ